MLSDEELSEIERVWAAATPAPWMEPRIYAKSEDEAAAAKAPEHIAALLAEVKRLRALLDGARNA